MAQTYIQAMCEMLKRNSNDNSYSIFNLQNENNNCTNAQDNYKNEV